MEVVYPDIQPQIWWHYVLTKSWYQHIKANDVTSQKTDIISINSSNPMLINRSRNIRFNGVRFVKLCSRLFVLNQVQKAVSLHAVVALGGEEI
jgi:hypothetical protein